MCPTRSDVRIDLARAELTRLRNEIDDWLEGYRALEQYSTQINALDLSLHEILKALDEALAALPVDGSIRVAYQACRDVERKTTWTRHVWQYYAAKFDQREARDADRRRAVQAADEAVWSCYAGAYLSLPEVERPAVPLPYLDSLYTPNAIPRDMAAVLRDRVISVPFLQAFLAELPLPVIGLPDVCSHAPWWLIYIGHEVGHHLQHDLLPSAGLVEEFRAHLRAALNEAASKGTAVPPGAADKWGAWGQEVFADAFSAYSLGPRAAWAIAELVMGDDVTMLREHDDYPPPAVRLALMAALPMASDEDRALALADVDLDALTTGSALRGFGGRDLRAAARDHLNLVPALAKAIHAWDCGGLGRLARLCRWREDSFSSNGKVHGWQSQLVSSGPLALTPSLDAPRLILSGGLAAWAQVSLIADEGQRVEEEERLAKRLIDAMIGSHLGGTRAGLAAAPSGGLKALSVRFAKQLLAKSPEELGM
jgi:hypothetical protein